MVSVGRAGGPLLFLGWSLRPGRPFRSQASCHHPHLRAHGSVIFDDTGCEVADAFRPFCASSRLCLLHREAVWGVGQSRSGPQGASARHIWVFHHVVLQTAGPKSMCAARHRQEPCDPGVFTAGLSS